MKKGINIWSFPSEMKITDCIQMAKNAGFDGIELALNESGELSLESSETEIRQIKNIAQDAGIALTSLASGLYWSYSLTSELPAIRAKSAQHRKETAGNRCDSWGRYNSGCSRSGRSRLYL